MGGINSGRRMCLFANERKRPIAEEAAILSISDLSRLGALQDGSAGLLRWDENACDFSHILDLTQVRCC